MHWAFARHEEVGAIPGYSSIGGRHSYPEGQLPALARTREYRALHAEFRHDLDELGWTRDFRDVYDLVNEPGAMPKESAPIFTTAIARSWERCRSFPSPAVDDLDAQARVWAGNRLLEGAVRSLIGTRASLDGAVFTEIADWPLGDGGPAQAVGFFFYYAPVRTLRTVEAWLWTASESEDYWVHFRAVLLRPLARLDADRALRTARELFDDSPLELAGMLGKFGGAAELDLLLLRLPQYRVRGRADERRRIESAIRKIQKRHMATLPPHGDSGG